MGAYINSEDQENERWLGDNGIRINYEDAIRYDDYEDCFLVVLIHNFMFTTAGIAFNQEERDYFLDGNDMKIKTYYIVEKEKLLPVSNLEHYLKRK